MSTVTELQNRVDVLESLLRERELKEAEEKAATIAAQQATDAAKTAEERATAAAAEREQVRVGSWVTHLTTQSPDADFASVTSGIPSTGWPPGVDESTYVFTGGTLPPKEADVATTTLGRALASLTKTI